MLSTNDTHISHITFDEMKRFSLLSPDDLSEDGAIFAEEVVDKVESCSICKKRFVFYKSAQYAFGSLSAVSEETLSAAFHALRMETDNVDEADDIGDAYHSDKIKRKEMRRE